MNNIETIQAVFFKKGHTYLCKYGDITFNVSKDNIILLRQSLKIPYNIEFIGYSHAQVVGILIDLFSDDIHISIKKGVVGSKHLPRFIVSFKEQNIIDGNSLSNVDGKKLKRIW